MECGTLDAPAGEYTCRDRRLGICIRFHRPVSRIPQMTEQEQVAARENHPDTPVCGRATPHETSAPLRVLDAAVEGPSKSLASRRCTSESLDAGSNCTINDIDHARRSIWLQPLNLKENFASITQRDQFLDHHKLSAKHSCSHRSPFLLLAHIHPSLDNGCCRPASQCGSLELQAVGLFRGRRW